MSRIASALLLLGACVAVAWISPAWAQAQSCSPDAAPSMEVHCRYFCDGGFESGEIVTLYDCCYKPRRDCMRSWTPKNTQCPSTMWCTQFPIFSGFDSRGELPVWSRNGTTDVNPPGQLVLTRGALTSVHRENFNRDIPGTYTAMIAAKVDGYTGNAESFGFKISDGTKRLMFQRRSDGFWAITDESGGLWVKVRPTSNFTGWGEYRFRVTDGQVSLRTRILPNGAWDGPTRWRLPKHESRDRVEVWLKGGEHDVHVDYIRLELPAP